MFLLWKKVSSTETPRIALTLIRGYLRCTRTECCCVGCMEVVGLAFR